MFFGRAWRRQWWAQGLGNGWAEYWRNSPYFAIANSTCNIPNPPAISHSIASSPHVYKHPHSLRKSSTHDRTSTLHWGSPLSFTFSSSERTRHQQFPTSASRNILALSGIGDITTAHAGPTAFDFSEHSIMTCTATTVMTESYEEPTLGVSSGTQMVPREELRKRRHSSYHPKLWAVEPDNIQLLVCKRRTRPTRG